MLERERKFIWMATRMCLCTPAHLRVSVMKKKIIPKSKKVKAMTDSSVHRMDDSMAAISCIIIPVMRGNVRVSFASIIRILGSNERNPLTNELSPEQ